MIGSDLPSLENDPATVKLLTDPLLLAMNQKGSNPRVTYAAPDRVEIVSDAPNGKLFRAVFDRRAHTTTAVVDVLKNA